MKININKLILLLLVLGLFSGLHGSAQTIPLTKVSGAITDEKGKLMDYATVALLTTKDSAIVKGALTNESGKYAFDKVKPGSYIVRATVVGYAKTYSKGFTVDGTEIIVPLLQLPASSRNLTAVNVTAAKPLIERKLDRTVINVENSVLAAGNSALEILEKAPGVTVDKDDNISLKGKQGVTVMLDGKLTYLSAAQLATLLRSTDGNTIQSIEIITNPSAKYDAAGNSGIIDIKLKKNKTTGTNGSLSATGAYGIYGKENASVNLNHKQGKLNVFGSYSQGDRNRANNISIDRAITNTDGTVSYFTQNTAMPQNSTNNTYRLGFDYDLSPKNTIGFLVNGYLNGETDHNSNNTLIGSQPLVTNSVQNTYSTIDQTYHNIAFNVNDKYQIDTAGQELSIDVDYSKFNNTNNAHYDTYFFNPNGVTNSPSAFIRNQSPSVININTAKLDYNYPFTKALKMETGFKGSIVKTDNDLQAQLMNNNTWINDTSRTNHFLYNEKIAAGYFNLSQTYKNTSVQAGVRAEYTNSTGTSTSSKNPLPQADGLSYLNFFPSVFINHTLNAKNEISFSYSRRIDRPGYDDLNPFKYYLDQYTYSQGNPNLRPQYTQSFEFNYTYNKIINLGLSYSHTADAITQVLIPNTATKSTYQTTLNLQAQNSYNVNINSPFEVTKWWSGNANLNGFYMHFSSIDLPGNYNLNDGQAAFQFKTTQTFLLGKTFKGELSGDYQSAMTYGVLKIRPQYGIDAGLSHSFMAKKVNLKFSVSDVLNTRNNNVTSVYAGQTLAVYQKNETRVARLTFTYNFGSTKFTSRKHDSSDDDENSRVKKGN